jgi:hypothetical protein
MHPSRWREGTDLPCHAQRVCMHACRRWRKDGLTLQHFRNVSLLCPESYHDLHDCANHFMRLSIDKGTLYVNNLVIRKKREPNGWQR